MSFTILHIIKNGPTGALLFSVVVPSQKIVPDKQLLNSLSVVPFIDMILTVAYLSAGNKSSIESRSSCLSLLGEKRRGFAKRE